MGPHMNFSGATVLALIVGALFFRQLRKRKSPEISSGEENEELDPLGLDNKVADGEIQSLREDLVKEKTSCSELEKVAEGEIQSLREDLVKEKTRCSELETELINLRANCAWTQENIIKATSVIPNVGLASAVNVSHSLSAEVGRHKPCNSNENTFLLSVNSAEEDGLWPTEGIQSGQIMDRMCQEVGPREDDEANDPFENDYKNASLLSVNSAEEDLPTDGIQSGQITERMCPKVGPGEEAEAFDPQAIDYKDAHPTTQKVSSDAIREMEIEYQYDVPSMETEPAYKYDVFLSFCGADTRLKFTDHLYHRIKAAGISVFLDSKELKCGQKIKEIFKAVDESQIYVPIFSKKFASRIWCLREVEHMERRHSESQLSHGKREIFPIFYDVKLRTGSYKDDMRKHEKYCRPGEPERWSIALKAVGGIIGRELKDKRQGEEIESIVIDVLRKYNGKHVDMTRDLVEDHRQIKEIIEKLDINSGGKRFIRIHGTGGIGKTTLAKVVFNKLSSKFERICFLNDVRKSSEHGIHGILDLQKRLLTDVDGPMLAEQITTVAKGKYRIKAVCNTKKVLLVLDDVDDEKQLEMLAESYNWFGSGSRIIITTRIQSIGNTLGQSSNSVVPNQIKGQSSSSVVPDQTEKMVDYGVREMELGQARQLFCEKAFRGKSPTEDCDALSNAIVSRVGKLPLAVEVIGSYLYDLGLALMPHGVTKRLLEETLEKLNKEGPFKEVRDVLMISYDRLGIKDRKVFLDIACFFTNEDQTYPVIMWDKRGYPSTSAICALRLLSLIKIRDNKFWMHDQVQDLGRDIARKEHPRRRLWTHKAAKKLLRKGDVKALSLTSDDGSHSFTAEELSVLPKLRFLRAKGKSSSFSGDLNNLLPNLIWLSWQKWGANFRAKNLHFSELVVLNLSHSDIEDGWDGWNQMKMNILKVLDLTGCTRLQRTPKFSNFKSLEALILARCINLTTIDASIGELKLLKTFNIKGCKALRELPAEFGSLSSLEEIIMPQYFQPFELPETFGHLKSLTSLILDDHPGISELPHSIGLLVELKRLSLCGCAGIKALPNSIGQMTSLTELDLSKSGIVELPDSIGSLKKLKVIRISYTVIKELPCSIGEMEKLEELHARKCWDLEKKNPEEIKKLSNLRILDLSYTRVSEFPSGLGCLSHLEKLEFSSSLPEGVPDLPSSLTHLHMQAPHFPSIPNLSSLINLLYLELTILKASVGEPEEVGQDNPPKEEVIHPLPSSLSTLIFRGVKLLPPFSSLENLSELAIIEYPMSRFTVSEDLTFLTTLKIRKCQLLVEIHGLPLLKKLRCLDLSELESLVEIHGMLGLESLEHFRIVHCNRIEKLPNLSKLDKLRHIELEACPNIGEIVGLNGTESLKLDKYGCIVLERLLDIPGSIWLSHIIPKYDVFLSFKGEDTRYSIVEILYRNLVHNKILVYRDDENMTHGRGIGKELLVALDDSHVYIPFLSRNYASSQWCLHELARMVELKKSKGKIILPIFYDVEKDDVKLESDLYREGLTFLGLFYGDEVDKWEKALKEVGKMDGYHLKTKSLEEIIESVTDEILRELADANLNRPPAAEE